MSNQREAYSKIENNLEQIQKLIKECEQIADQNGLKFTLSTPRKSMEYIPESVNEPDPWNSSNNISGWMTSSDYC